MGHVLICSIGNRDLRLADEKLEPALVHGVALSARQRGEYILAHKEIHGAIRLPIVEKALSFVQNKTGKLDKLVLIVSDQPEALTADEHRNKDTIAYGNIMREWIPLQPTWRDFVFKKNIELMTVTSNPADYDNMRDFLSTELPKVKNRLGADHTYYLALSGGTPAMTAMLLFVGSDVFGETCIPLYISDRKATQPIPLAAGRNIYLQSVRRAVMTAISSYSYAAAAKLTKDNFGEALRIVDSDSAQRSIIALLQYAHQRLAFDFKAASDTLAPVHRDLPAPHRDSMTALLQETEQLRDNEIGKLLDVYFGCEIKYGNGEYADFLGRIFRFHEGILRYLAITWGNVQFNRSGRRLDASWVASIPELHNWLTHFNYKNNPIAIDYQNRDVTRLTMRAVAEFFATSDEKRQLLDQIDQVEALADLRNNTIIAHSFAGVSRQSLAAKFSGDDQADASVADTIPLHLRHIYEAATEQLVGMNPFDQINRLLETLLTKE